MLPLGFLKMALEKNATVSKEKKFTVLSFPMENGTAYKTNVKGYIDDKGFVEKSRNHDRPGHARRHQVGSDVQQL